MKNQEISLVWGLIYVRGTAVTHLTIRSNRADTWSTAANYRYHSLNFQISGCQSPISRPISA